MATSVAAGAAAFVSCRFTALPGTCLASCADDALAAASLVERLLDSV